MILTKITPSDELAEIFIEILLNTTDRVTKVSDASVLRGHANGVGKLGSLQLKDLAIIESRLFPETAFGSYLDDIAQRGGMIPRLSSASSSTYLRLVGDPGTIYETGVHTFKSTMGIDFILTENITIPSIGFTYAKVISQNAGLSCNVDPLTINQVSPVPTGHEYCINEYAAIGGRDAESDDLFRERLLKGVNQLSRDTKSMIEQVLIKINPRVLKIYHLGIHSSGKTQLGVLTCDGGDLSGPEITTITNKLEKFFNITEYRPINTSQFIGIEILNMSFLPIDISFRVAFEDGFNQDVVRKNIQINLNKYIDFRYWTKTKLDWDDLFLIVKRTNGVKYVPDEYFTPYNDIQIPFDKLPRIRGFQMMDLSGNIITDLQGVLNPIFYPNQPDLYFQTYFLNNL